MVSCDSDVDNTFSCYKAGTGGLIWLYEFGFEICDVRFYIQNLHLLLVFEKTNVVVSSGRWGISAAMKIERYSCTEGHKKRNDKI